jgi:hypothetical protein
MKGETRRAKSALLQMTNLAEKSGREKKPDL